MIPNSIKVIVGIDFGTTRTGYGFAFKYSPSDIILRYMWPDTKSRYPKTLTHLLYDANEGLAAWGFSAKKEITVFSKNRQKYYYFKNFKMNLLDKKTWYVLNNEIYISNNGIKFGLKRLIADYLRKIKELALQDVRGKTAQDIRDNEILWSLSVPAMWDDLQKSIMRHAAVDAGLIKQYDSENLALCLEPECAALTYLDQDGGVLKDGDVFLVLDCGGGTIDIVVHKVTADNGTYRLQDIVRNTGDALGSTYVDLNFLNFLYRSIISHSRLRDVELLDTVIKNNPDIYKLMDSWEIVKCNFDYTKSEDMVQFGPIYKFLKSSCPEYLEYLSDQQFGDDNYLEISRKDFDEILNPQQSNGNPFLDGLCPYPYPNLIDRITHLVDKSIIELKSKGEECDYIIMVGGFSENPFLQQRIKQEFILKNAKVKKVIVPPGPSAAIVYGAVKFGLDPSKVRLRISTLTYGVECLEEFIEGTHSPAKKKYYTGIGNLCEGVFDTFIRAGDRPKSTIVREYPTMSKAQSNIKVKLFSSPKQKVMYTDDPLVHEHGFIEMETNGYSGNIKVEFEFGQTEINVKVTNPGTGKFVQKKLDFKWSY